MPKFAGSSIASRPWSLDGLAPKSPFSSGKGSSAVAAVVAQQIFPLFADTVSFLVVVWPWALPNLPETVSFGVYH